MMLPSADARGAAAAGSVRFTDQVTRVAPLDTTILLGGETGTGKTRLARQIHELSNRRNEPFVVVNCGSLAENLIESELFGHVRGSFTGADRDRVGKFEEAGEGTIFLDEIDSLPAALQAKLLRAMEERAFEQVGSNRTQRVRARFIVASNRRLEDEVAAGRFRADLFYRLNVVTFHLPALRERPEMVSVLAEEFLQEFAGRRQRDGMTFSSAAMIALSVHSWPGNIRELRNVIERAVALCPALQVGIEDFPDAVRLAQPRSEPVAQDLPPSLVENTLGEVKEKAERARIMGALIKHSQNRLRAAAELGISRMTLYKKLHQYGLMPQAVRPSMSA